jgi:signal transduction histidine kinase
MVVQAGAARFAVGEDDEEARARLLSVEDAGRAAVADLRRLLGLLRADDEDEPQVGDAVPGLAQLPDLAATLGRAGLEVRLDAHGLPEGLPPALDHALYRLVQEALTNVLKHSTGGSAGVRLRVDGGQVAVEVDDPGPARDHGTAHDPLSTGHGLVGLRERIAVFGGRLDAGPAGRGWRLCAEVPLTGGPAALSAAAP